MAKSAHLIKVNVLASFFSLSDLNMMRNLISGMERGKGECWMCTSLWQLLKTRQVDLEKTQENAQLRFFAMEVYGQQVN